MDGELVTDSSPSDLEGSGSNKNRSPRFSYADQFWEVFPYYLAIGMTETQFWDGDPVLCKSYRKAQEIRDEKLNQQLWMQGMYVYEAIGDMAPVLRAFAKKGSKAQPYSDQPYALNAERKKQAAEREEKKKMQFAKARLEMWMTSHNAKFKEKEG